MQKLIKQKWELTEDEVTIYATFHYKDNTITIEPVFNDQFVFKHSKPETIAKIAKLLTEASKLS